MYTAVAGKRRCNPFFQKRNASAAHKTSSAALIVDIARFGNIEIDTDSENVLRIAPICLMLKY
jgi:hypothetical protein